MSEYLRARFALWLSVVFLSTFLLGSNAAAINIVLDYRYDTNGFFGAGNPDGQGAAARTALSAAADFFSGILTDNLDAIPYADPNTPGGQNTPVWRQVITHPGTGQAGFSVSSAANAAQDGLTNIQGAADEFRDISVPANQFTIYPGGRNLPSIAEGGTGAGFFGSTSFNDNVDQRGKPSGEYSTWGGFVTFDNSNLSDWHYGHTTTVPGSKLDFFSVAMHEIGHTLGLGAGWDEWNAWQVGAEFRGPQAFNAWVAEDPASPSFASGIPTVSSSDHHWKDDAVSSYVLGTTTLQETAMDPVIRTGTRKLFTNVDTYALRDIGWTIPDSVFEVTTLSGDYNGDLVVDAADYTVWRDSLGTATPVGTYAEWAANYGNSGSASRAVPEATSMLLALLGLGSLAAGNRYR